MTSPRPLLVFGAHPDDIEFGCGAVVAREAEAGRFAHFAIATRGEAATNGTPEERTREAEQAAARLGATVEFLELGGDAHLAPAIGQVLALARLVRQHRPAWVLAPTATANQHPDHRALGTMVRDAVRLARFGGLAELRDVTPHTIQALFFYAITVEAEPSDAGPLLIDVSGAAVIARWTAAMDAHVTQSRTRNYSELQLTRARLHGLRAGVEHAWPLFPNDPPVFDSLQPLSHAARRF